MLTAKVPVERTETSPVFLVLAEESRKEEWLCEKGYDVEVDIKASADQFYSFFKKTSPTTFPMLAPTCTPASCTKVNGSATDLLGSGVTQSVSEDKK